MSQILVIEDNEDIRNLLKTALSLRGHQVVSAANGQEGLDVLNASQNSFSVILLDLMIPIMSGWEFLVEVGNDPKHSKIPVVVMSGAGEQAAPTAPAGCTEFLRKPVDLSQLFQLVRQYCTAIA